MINSYVPMSYDISFFLVGKPIFITTTSTYRGLVNEELTLEVEIYSNPKTESSGISLQNIDTLQFFMNSNYTMMYIRDTDVTTKRYGRTVVRNGQTVVVYISSLSPELVGRYVLIVENKDEDVGGKSTFNFEIKGNV